MRRLSGNQRAAGTRVARAAGVARAASVALALMAALGACSTGSTAPSESASPSASSGQATCDAATVAAAVGQDVTATYPDAKFKSLETFTCRDGWVVAKAQIETSGTTVRSVFFLRADGSTWVAVRLEDICAKSGTAPESIQREACGTS